MKIYKPGPRPVHGILLGPVPCRSCRSPVVWDGMGWLFLGTRLIHNELTCLRRSGRKVEGMG